MAVPPAFSTFSAVTELFVTLAVLWFFYNAFARKSYRFGVIAVALVYETVFNIAYMVTRLNAADADGASPKPGWYIAILAAHGLLSIAMFLGLVGLVVWSYMQRRAGVAHPFGDHRPLAYTFLALWGVSVLSGEAIYLLYWTNVVPA